MHLTNLASLVVSRNPELKSEFILSVLGFLQYICFRYFFRFSTKNVQTKSKWNSSHVSPVSHSLQRVSTPPPPSTYLLFVTGSVWFPVRNLHKARLSKKCKFFKYGSKEKVSLKILYEIHFLFRYTSAVHSCRYWFWSDKVTTFFIKAFGAKSSCSDQKFGFPLSRRICLTRKSQED